MPDTVLCSIANNQHMLQLTVTENEIIMLLNENSNIVDLSIVVPNCFLNRHGFQFNASNLLKHIHTNVRNIQRLTLLHGN